MLECEFAEVELDWLEEKERGNLLDGRIPFCLSVSCVDIVAIGDECEINYYDGDDGW